MNRAPGFIRNVAPAVLYTLAIFVAGSWPHGPEAVPVFALQDKVLHMLAFGGLEVLIWRALVHLSPAKDRAWLFGVSVLLTSLLGGLLELWQSLLPSRQADVLDWLADIAGALFVALGLWRSRAALQMAARAESELAARAPASKR